MQGDHTVWYNRYIKEETMVNTITRERPWHVNVTEEQVEHAKRIFARVDETVGQVEYEEDEEGRRFLFGSFHLGSFDMWGNLVIYNGII
tara:strand:- start:4333 stop:4599 length:267 start_codon:yes stop_codon:yes gene_type:complete